MKSSHRIRSNFHEKLKYFYYTLKLFGLASYSVEKSSQTFVMNGKSYLVLTFSLAFWGCGILASLHSIADKTEMIERLYQVTFLLQQIITIFCVIFNFLKRDNVEKLWKIVHEFDEAVVKLNWKTFEHKFRLCNYFLVLFYSIFVGFIFYYNFSALDHVNKEFLLFKMIIFQSTNQFCLLIVFRFILSVQFVSSGLKTLGDSLE